MTQLDRDYWVTVCDYCKTASCWHGEHMCQRSQTSGTIRMKASKLFMMGREWPGNFSREKLLDVCGSVEEVEP